MFKTLIREPMLDEFESGGGAGEEVLEPAVPAETSEGEEAQEPAEPAVETSEGKSDADAAFAQMRRDLEEARRLRDEAEKDRDQYKEALGLFFEGDDIVPQAHARATGKDVDEVKAEMEAAARAATLESENKELSDKLREYEISALMSKDLAEIQAIDPNVKSLDDLGETFLNYISKGLTGKEAYYAAKAQEVIERAVPPKEIGKVNQSSEEQAFYTKDEVAAMSPSEVKANYDRIRASMSRW